MLLQNYDIENFWKCESFNALVICNLRFDTKDNKDKIITNIQKIQFEKIKHFVNCKIKI